MHDMIRGLSSKEECIYLDYQASTPLDERVLAVLLSHNRDLIGNPHASEHVMGWNANLVLEEQRQSISANLGCDADEVIFTSGATESNNLAILGLAEASAETPKRILVSAIEHKSVLEAAGLAARRYGHSVELVPVNHQGILDVSVLESRMGPDVLLVSVMLVNNEVGSIQPVTQIAALAEKHNVFFHTDAAHALACSPINFRDAGIHSLSLSGHKIYGPKGVGVLIVRRDVQNALSPQIVGGGQQGGLRAGTVAVPMCAAFAKAVNLISNTANCIERNSIIDLRDRFARTLLRLPGVFLNGPPLEVRHPGNLNLRFERWDAADLLGRLQPRVAASSGSACTSGTPEPSYVLQAMGLSADQAGSSIRFGFGRGLDANSVERAADVISDILIEY